MITDAEMAALHRIRSRLSTEFGLRVRVLDRLSGLGVPSQGNAITSIEAVISHVERVAALVHALTPLAD